MLNESDLAASTGLPDAQVLASLTKLEALGLISFEGGPPAPAVNASTSAASRVSSVQLRAAVAAPAPPPNPQAKSPTPAGPIPAGPSSSGPATTPRGRPAPANATLASSTPAQATPAGSVPANVTGASEPTSPEERAAMLEDVDLEPAIRKRIFEVHRDLDRRDHYALLGVGQNADKKLVKRAYYELAATFHPDRYFRKRLGSFQVRMEAVFARLTIAHDTLSNKESRSEYDSYLSEQRISQAIEEHLERGLTLAKQAEATVESLVQAEEVVAVQPTAPIATSPQVDVAARREALARRLLGGNASRTSSSQNLKAASADKQNTPVPMPTADAVNALKRRYEERMQKAKASEALKFAGRAETALAANDLVAAATAFQIAAKLSPADAALEKKASEARVKADALLSDTYTRQARYEESQNQWPEAARSWGRVCKVSPNNPIAHERAANAVAKAAGDLHAGARFAQRACELEPKNALFRITLATCYSAAGLTLNARRELDTAAQLAPHDVTIQTMIKRVGQPA